MSRFAYAIDVAQAPLSSPIASLAKNFHEAVDQAEAEGLDATTDPAVLLLGVYIAFHTHADVNTASGYHKLIAMCHDRIYNAQVPQ